MAINVKVVADTTQLQKTVDRVAPHFDEMSKAFRKVSDAMKQATVSMARLNEVLKELESEQQHEDL